MKYILKQLLGVSLNIVYLFTSLFPRRVDLWLFSSWSGQRFLDNPKYIYLYALKQPNVVAIWLTKNKELFTAMHAEGLPVVYSSSLRGIWLQLRCRVVVFTHAVHEEFTPFLIASRVFRVQTWHGVPIKKIGYDDEKAKLTRKRQKLIQWILPYRLDRCDLVLATNKEDCNIYRSAFNVKDDRVIITGYPRNDVLCNGKLSVLRQKNAIRNLRRVIYMPTFRGTPGSEFPLLAKSGFDYIKYDKQLENLGIIFEIKLHPVQSLSKEDKTQIQNCINIKIAENYTDIYVLLSQYDALITDYSGIYFDFMLTGKPIFMAPFDIVSYLQNDRSMYYDYNDICPSSVCLKWDDLFEAMKDNNYNFYKYNNLAKRFHFYRDEYSSNRAFAAILKNLNSD